MNTLKSCLLIIMLYLSFCTFASDALKSIETGYTIMQVRTGHANGESIVIGTSYEGTVVCFDYDGNKQWENPLSGYMNHDIFCADIDNDNNDEILAANANGTIYCLDDDGALLWSFKANNAPMYTVCALKSGTNCLVACGGFDKNVYYLNRDGEEITHFHSTSYGIDKQSGKFDHAMNFMRPVLFDGKEVLAVHSALNTNWSQGSIYLFEYGQTEPVKKIKSTVSGGACWGTFATNNLVDGRTEILMGGNNLNSLPAVSVVLETETATLIDTKTKGKDYSPAGYRLASVEAIPHENSFQYAILFGNRIFLVDPEGEKSTEVLTSTYAYNGWCQDKTNQKLILASSQSGGSCIHMINYGEEGWKSAFKNLKPKGKIDHILTNSNQFKNQLASFTRPEWERDPIDVLVMGAGTSAERKEELAQINSHCPKFITDSGIFPHMEDWDRSAVENERYREGRDKRKKYDYTASQVVNHMKEAYGKADHGINFWSGHGSDPYYYSLETHKAVIDEADGLYTIPVFAELEQYGEDFQWMTDDFMFPLADYYKDKNGLISLRNKHLFWQSLVYTPAWDRLISGEFADVFVSSMEESNSKTMDMSVSGRMGLWASGVMNRWGCRFTRDNPCYDRLRQLSYQRLPNHALRMFVYNIASGASVVHNTSVNEEYTDLLWYMLAKGILFVPKREEIVSFNPVHLSMLDPDEAFVEGNHVKDITLYDEQHEKDNPMVISHTNGTWAGAPVTEWDFSNYATGGMERRMEFLPPYPNGMVLTTPPTDSNSEKGELTSHLHPIYKNMLEEFYTDGRNYYSDRYKTKSFRADTYGPTIKGAIKNAAQKLPLTVDGRVAWVTAETDPLHLRLTLVDGGYVNPNDQTVTINFHTANVKKITNLIDQSEIDVTNKSATVTVPCGLFTFLDIELNEPLSVNNNIPTSSDPSHTKKTRVYSEEKIVSVFNAEGYSARLVNSLGQTISYRKNLSNVERFNADTGVVIVHLSKEQEVETHKILVR